MSTTSKIHLKTFFLLFCLGFVITVYSQGSTIGRVTYKETIAKSGQESIVYYYDLFFNNSVSVYEEDLSKTHFGQVISPNSDGTFNVLTVPFRNEPLFVYTSLKERKRIFQIFLLNEKRTIEDKFEKISWELKAEVKEIGSFQCQKATGNFRGRNYTVWFTTKIPVNFGPWKFEGLNGLILEVEEEYGLYHVIATDIDLYTSEPDEVKQKISDYTKISPGLTFKSFLDLLSIHNEKSEKIARSKLSKGQTPMAENHSLWMLEKFEPNLAGNKN
ncbi:MAG: GLPGLI family protein [Bacteroidetes bacterium]|nr:GLPGLI family protein [Bacteroidota bacterium]